MNVGNKLVADFKKKARLFSEFFASESTPAANDSYCQDWLFSIQKIAYLPSISKMMTYSKSLDLSSLIRVMVMIIYQLE